MTKPKLNLSTGASSFASTMGESKWVSDARELTVEVIACFLDFS